MGPVAGCWPSRELSSETGEDGDAEEDGKEASGAHLETLDSPRRGVQQVQVNTAEILHPVVTSPMAMTSKLLPATDFRVLSASSFQRLSGAPETYQSDPLSATIMP
jgi:hypothetical protein